MPTTRLLHLWFAVAVTVSALAFTSRCFADPVHGPIKVRPERVYPLLMPDGSVWGFSVQALAEGRLAVTAIESRDDGRTWGPRRIIVELPRVRPPETVWGDTVPIVDRATGELHCFLLKWDQTDKKRPFAKLALWHLKSKSAAPYTSWTEPSLLYDGYIGALLSVVQNERGTLVAPFAFMTTNTYSSPARGMAEWIFMGQHTSTAVYSTDHGASFKKSSDVNIPASILLGNENGAVEPVCLPLTDGRIWMMMRTQLGRHWESFSKDGATWSEPGPSRFIGTDSPVSLTRLVDGRIVIMWNCCQRFPYAFGGRQVLHAAISADERRTWNGFREVLRDPQRLKPAMPIKGDYGSGYPVATPTRDGQIVFATGQGATSGTFRLDPAWLLEKEQRDDFHNGLESWSTYGTKGVELIAHPDRPAARVLKIARIDTEFPAGAVWNFPNSRRGRVRVRFSSLPGAARCAVTLTDHFSSPFDREAELNALFTMPLGAGDLDAPGTKQAGSWHELDLDWDFAMRECRVSLDGRAWKALPQLRLNSEGANYLRFHILDDEPTPGGLLVESVAARVEPR